MKAVYVITSSGRDEYTAMTRLSALSLRLSNPSANVVVVCDSIINQAVRSRSAPILDEADEWIAC